MPLIADSNSESSNTTDVILFSGASTKYRSRPLGIYRLASHLRQHNITVQTVWAWDEPEALFYGICKRYLNDSVAVVGISSTLMTNPATGDFFGVDMDTFKKRLTLIKRLAPNAKIVLGGSQVTYSPITGIPGLDLIDIFVKSQGEESLLAIVNAVKNNTRFRTVSIAPVVVDQTIYPFNDFNRSHTDFIKSDCVVHGEALPYEFARGCIFKCKFCDYEITGKSVNDFTKSKDIIRDELLKNYYEHGVTDYNIIDDLINDSEEKVNMIYDVVESLPFAITFSGYLRLDMLRRFPTMSQKLQDSGLIGCFLGIETIDDRNGRMMGKGLGINRINEALTMLDNVWKGQVCIESGIILGLPHDTPDTVHKTLDWLREPVIARTIKYVSLAVLNLNPYKNISEMDKDYKKYGYTINESVEVLSQPGYQAAWTTEHYSQKQALKDARYFRQEYEKDRQFNTVKMDIFQLPYLLSLSDRRQEILDVVLRDQSTEWATGKEWQEYVTDLIATHRKKYLKLLLKGQ